MSRTIVSIFVVGNNQATLTMHTVQCAAVCLMTSFRVVWHMHACSAHGQATLVQFFQRGTAMPLKKKTSNFSFNDKYNDSTIPTCLSYTNLGIPWATRRRKRMFLFPSKPIKACCCFGGSVRCASMPATIISTSECRQYVSIE